MRRRELQTIQLKLSELKEYEQAKLERIKTRQQVVTPRTPTPPSDNEVLAMPSTSVPAILLASGATETEEDACSTTKPTSSM
ncbi:GL21180 [Drosophila persimilis]|uniref:Cell division cycle protein 26 homolog n=2 Tax=pseudoobscura subgroup TaxID=32358 RepID=Q29K26_DROPS|nr:uncharacterized protein LOC6597974 [Drosophila persimilis]XP_015036860.1 uncharacterized protein LOC4816661 [Drosophila pseudoobscura]EDW27240.1 GL21180 [Drosophila persimilis]